MINKKGAFEGSLYIVIALVTVLAMVFLIGLYEIGKEEIVDPVASQLQGNINNSTDMSNESKTKYINLMQNSKTELYNINIPYNLILWFLMFIIIGISGFDSSRKPKASLTSVLFYSTGGIALLIFIASMSIIELIEFFRVDILYYIFGDLLATHLPLGVYILDNWLWLGLLFALYLILVNRIFGSEDDFGTFR